MLWSLHLLVKDVHKQPPLDLVGWFTLGSISGPEPHILPIHSCISRLYTESPLLLLFHPERAFSEATAAGKLPLTLYESVSVTTTSEPNGKAMDIDGAAQAKSTKFRELVYSIETGEAEMISVDFVARGGGNATAVEGLSGSSGTPQVDAVTAEEFPGGIRINRGKQKEREKDREHDSAFDESMAITAEDEESKQTRGVEVCRSHIDKYSTFLPYSENKRHPYAESPHTPPPSLSRRTPTILSIRSHATSNPVWRYSNGITT